MIRFALPLVLAAGLAAAQPPSDQDLEQAIHAVYPALVRIHVVAEQGGGGRMQKERGSGSGAIIHPDGYILTNHHVAGRATKLVVRLADRQEVPAKLVGSDPLADLAVLKIERKDLRDPSAALPVAAFGDSDALKVGDAVLAMGSPAGLSQSVTRGIVANTEMISPGGGGLQLDGETVGELVRWIGHDAVIFPGNSGGPLVNLEGKVVGVNEVGIGSIGGAIPSNLAKRVAGELIAHGRVRRSWTGLAVQPLLKSLPSAQAGILVAGVLAGSPAAKAGLQAGDVITACNGQPVAESRAPEDVPVFNRMILESPVGSQLSFEGLRGKEPIRCTLTTEEREPAQPREVELLSWGITARDLTKMGAKERHRDDNQAVVVQSLRPGGPATEAKPPIARGDLIVSVGGKPVATVDELIQVSRGIIGDQSEPVPTLVTYEHEGDSYLTVVKIGPEPEEDKPALARKAWLGVATQVISQDLAEALGIPGTKGVRVTRVFPGSTAEQAGLQSGDLLLKLDGTVISASRPEESEVFADTIRQYRVGTEVSLDLRRGGEALTVKVTLERSPEQASELPQHENETFEFTARELSRDDRSRKHLGDDLKGVLVTSLAASGWAALGGLQGGDIILSINDQTVDSIPALKTLLAKTEKERPDHVVLFVRRGIVSRYIELEPVW